ncbi:MAG: MarR family transcriptional regulator [Rhizobacter sp.]|nr:MarR family transcriptional regulator [Rhizobacter sp.]
MATKAKPAAKTPLSGKQARPLAKPATKSATKPVIKPATKPAAKKTVKKAGKAGAGAHPDLGPIGTLEDFIPYKLSVVANRVSQSIGKLFDARFNIQIPEWRIIMALYAYNDLVFNEVVDRTSMDKARVSRAQRRLVDLGLIATSGDPDDRRKVILSLTPKGTEMCENIFPEAAERAAWYLGALDEHEHRQLDVILDKLMKRSTEL